MLFSVITQLINWGLPVNCAFCGLRTEAKQPNICPECTHDLPWLTHTCSLCGLPLPMTAAGASCGHCLKTPPPFQQLQALFYYQFPVDQLILRLKFQQQFIYARLLGELLASRCAQYYTTATPKPAILLPMPLHSRRLRQRGFNQAVELARPVAKQLSIPIGYGLVKRVKYTEPQMELALKDRAQNVQQAFAANNKLTGLHVAIIDDVVTSGHTVNALAVALRNAGVARIDIWAIARALR